MGFFSEIASEARRGMAGSQAQTSARQTAVTPLAPVAPVPAPVPPVTTNEPPAAQPAPVLETAIAPTEAKQEPASSPEPPEQPTEPPAIDLTAETGAADDDAKRKAHEAAETKRKAEFDAKQAEKKAARQATLDRIAAMNGAELLAAATDHVAADTEKLTRRNMKEAVAEHVSAKCREDVSFARLVMDPGKSMVNCFRYINRKAYEYIQDELKANGIKPGPGSEGYGCDVPDDLCYQWAEDYFKDPDAEEDKTEEEKFVPKPYVPTAKHQNRSAAKKKQAADKKPPEPKSNADTGQITFGGFAPVEEKAG